MKCTVHPDVDATGFCRNCGKALCPQCVRDVRGAFYCEECLSSMVFGPQSTQSAKLKSSRPAAALVLGLVPGLGAVYNGEYFKALIHVCIFGALITARHDTPGSFHTFLGLALFCFYFYMPIDAYHVARARETGEHPPEILPLGGLEGRLPVGAILLIGLGLLLLLSNFGFFEWNWVSKLWPLGLIALGAWLLTGRMRQTP